MNKFLNFVFTNYGEDMADNAAWIVEGGWDISYNIGGQFSYTAYSVGGYSTARHTCQIMANDPLFPIREIKVEVIEEFDYPYNDIDDIDDSEFIIDPQEFEGHRGIGSWY